jgi:hypothetical protein
MGTGGKEKEKEEKKKKNEKKKMMAPKRWWNPQLSGPGELVLGKTFANLCLTPDIFLVGRAPL